jgi:hypothetical protein
MNVRHRTDQSNRNHHIVFGLVKIPDPKQEIMDTDEMTPQPSVPVEIFLERRCRSSALVLEAVYEAADSILMNVCVLFRDRDVLEFHRRGVVVCPATFIGGKLAFYGVMTSEEIRQFINHHIPQLSLTGEFV